MRTSSRVIPALALAAVVGGAATSVAAQEDFAWPRLLVVGTPGTSSGSFASTNAWAPVLQQETGTTIRVVPEDSETQRHRRLTDRRDIMMSSVSVAELRFQIQGFDSYAAMAPVPQSVVWHHNDTPWGFVVSGNSALQSLEDIRESGARVTEGLFSPLMVTTVRQGLPAYLGMTPEEAEAAIDYVQASSYVENCRSVVEGRSDVAWCAPVSAVLAEMEGAPGGIRWLGLDAEDTEAWSRLLDGRPMLIPTEISMGVDSARGVGGGTSTFVYSVPTDTDADLVYNLAKFFHDSYDAYAGSHPLSARMSMEQFRTFLDRSPLPVHEGTVRFLREIGEWTEDDDAWNEVAIERMDAWMSARQAAIEEAREAGIMPDSDNPDFMAIIEKHTEGLEGYRMRL